VKTYEVAVVGAGPAGAAAAITLRALGRTVVLLDGRGRNTGYVAETLSASIEETLRKLGVWTRFLRLPMVPCSGILSAWGSERPVWRSSIADARGRGWHIDRRYLDDMLVEAARAVGTVVLRDARAAQVELQDMLWKVESTVGPLAARWLVDATGRGAKILRRLGVPWKRFDDQVALTARLHSGGGPSHRVLVLETAADGWWYSLPCGRGHRVVALVTDARTLRTREEGITEFFRSRLAQTRHVSTLVTGEGVRTPLARGAACGAALQSYGLGWSAVGEAAQALDPLSGQGMCHALGSAIETACGIDASLAGHPDLLARLAKRQEFRFARHLEHRRSLWMRELRWSTAAWWRHRQGPSPVPEEHAAS
jgi:flavin-dependent dehydrogenase